MGGLFSNIGLDEVYTDNGVGEVTRQASDNGRFKIPSLRNVALTGPYMHDGRFETLEEVIEHYSDGIEDNPNLDSRLQENGQPIVFNISEQETEAIIAFMHTLTDYDMITDPKFSNPFKTK
jgi:cytochrome c peroxidase